MYFQPMKFELKDISRFTLLSLVILNRLDLPMRTVASTATYFSIFKDFNGSFNAFVLCKNIFKKDLAVSMIFCGQDIVNIEWENKSFSVIGGVIYHQSENRV